MNPGLAERITSGGIAVLERFKSKTRDASGCWRWLGSKNHGGYGLFWDGKKQVAAHTWAFETWRGPIPIGKQLDHVCKNRACVNPGHLEIVTSKENHRRRMKDVCAHGHPFDSMNTYLELDGTRGCKECRREATRRWRRKSI